ncbi:unnamed protein product [Rotaria sordida]|uniref:Uncharacterized protein n=1 Tax=Rotaria sordida TaxID=392033 RepID=A0A815QW57_9BILA|nr:unnamed protein product [Rotaria sordida]CAF3815701.1 unnamed protein product [Rotaria sordida]
MLTYFNLQYFSQHYNQTINYPNDNINKAVHLKELNIYKYCFSSFKFHYQIEDFYKIFLNIKQLKCNIDQTNDLLFLLKHLRKLSILKVYL